MTSLTTDVVVRLARWLKGKEQKSAVPHASRFSLVRGECECRFCVSARTVQRLRQISRRLDQASAERNELLCGRLLADQVGLMEYLLEESGGTA